MPGELTIGIHTNGGCNPPTGNAGTSLANDGLEAALQNFHGPNTIYVDTFTSSINEDDTIFYPFDTVSEGINAAINGGQLFITTVVFNFKWKQPYIKSKHHSTIKTN